jgi:mono/diheme cytochrome c family protein
MSIRTRVTIAVFVAFGIALCSCVTNPQPSALTPIPTLAPGATATLMTELQAPLPEGSVPIAIDSGDAAEGAPLYMIHCTVCHGVEGEGVDGPALRNNDFISAGEYNDIFATISEGRAGTSMPAWLATNGGPYTEFVIAKVIAFLKTLQGIPPLPSATPMPPEPTDIPSPPGGPTPEPAQPSQPGDAGPAASRQGDPGQGRTDFGTYCAACHGPEGMEQVGIPNPGSEDGIVPELNPIDPSLVNQDPLLFAINVDLFIEHGSVPEGPSPLIMMPAFGDAGMLTEQQISDLITYIMLLNGVSW